MNAGPRYFGKYRATVLNNLDAQNQGRIQVQLGDRYGPFPSTWALPCLPLAGRMSASMVSLPAVGSMVWIEFEAGDPDFPIWSGGFWPDPSGFPMEALLGATPANPNIHLQTTSGTTVTLSDNPMQQVMIKTVSGAMISIGGTSVIISNGLGATIEMTGPSVNINNGALTIT